MLLPTQGCRDRTSPSPWDPHSVQEGVRWEPGVARWHRNRCGTHSTARSQGLSLEPSLIQDWRHLDAGPWAYTTYRGSRQKKRWGSHSEAVEVCMTMAKVTLALVKLCFLDGECL